MFFANDICGVKTHIDNAKSEKQYFCPACKGRLIQKRGRVIAYHFAHEANKECDPWYTAKNAMSKWHIEMQNLFAKSSREVVVWNKDHSEYHIADVALQPWNKKYVIEFQHSTISQEELIIRSRFYMECGYNIIWVFDFCTCEPPKTIFLADRYPDNNASFVWPGKSRVKFLDRNCIDKITFNSGNTELYIFFHINTGRGILRDIETNHWDYIDPLHRKELFVLLDLSDFDETSYFSGKCLSEKEFHQLMQNLGKYNNALSTI